MSIHGTTNQRGYGAAHKRARTVALRQLHDGDPCCRCGGPMFREFGSYLDLDHDDTRTGYRGLAHRSCNRSAGATKGNQQRGALDPEPAPRRSTRPW